MKIEVGQDAVGRWAWMIRDAAGRVVASDDDYWSADLAMQEALAQMKRRTVSEHRGIKLTRVA